MPLGKGTRWLAGIVAVLVTLVLVSRFGSAGSGTPALVADTAPTAAAVDTPPAPAPVRRSQPIRRPAPVAQARATTPALDMLVRAEARRRITRAGTAIYLDSLLQTGDSLLRRWPERPGEPVTLAFVQDSFFTARNVDPGPIREAFDRWQEARIGLTFSVVPDPTAAQIVVEWIDQFDPEESRTGQTDLEIAANGELIGARITLALRAPDGAGLDLPALRTTALHEAGHALGLGHSGRAGDIMHPSPTAPRLSERDRRTVEFIYSLPPGSVRGAP